MHYLHKDNQKNKVSVVSPHHPNAKKAVLDFEVIESKRGFSLLSVNLHTGRPHQIRVQLSTIGHPIFGDQKYGEHVNKKGQQIALWAHYIQFEHPVKKEPIGVYSLPPSDYPWDLWNVDTNEKTNEVFTTFTDNKLLPKSLIKVKRIEKPLLHRRRLNVIYRIVSRETSNGEVKNCYYNNFGEP